MDADVGDVTHYSTSLLAGASGYSVQQVRDLEHLGVIPPALRRPNGYRQFTGAHATALRTYRQLAIAVGTLVPIFPLLVGAALWPLIMDPSLARQLVMSAGSKGRRRIAIALVIAACAIWVLLSPLATVRGLLTSLLIGFAIGTVFAFFWPFCAALTSGRTVRDSVREFRWVPIFKTQSAGPAKPWHVVAAPMIALAILFILPFGMWLPQENITTTEERITGFVLEATEVWTTILSDDKRVTIVKSEEVTTRVVCGQGVYESVATLLSRADGEDGPRCED